MSANPASVTVGLDGFQRMLDLLIADGLDVFGPTVSDGAIVIRPLQSVDEFPLGRTTTARPGRVDLENREDRARFGWALPAQSWKPLVHPARVRTMTMHQPAESEHSVTVSVASRRARRQAFVGVRPCELAALERLDTVLIDRPPTPDPTYRGLRRDAFLVVVNCSWPAATCFCTSMDTGPHVDARSQAHDLEITELVDDDITVDPRYVVQSISSDGRAIVDRLIEDGFGAFPAAGDDTAVAENRAAATRHIDLRLDTANLPERLGAAHDAVAWTEIADACLACGNCTAVCPTCFCTTIDDVGDLTGLHVDRWRSWESCFSLEFSRVGSRPVRSSLASRYRQWMTHKLGSWHDQFGESGCVGCGRCTAWCPVGIDFVEVATRLNELEGAPS